MRVRSQPNVRLLAASVNAPTELTLQLDNSVGPVNSLKIFQRRRRIGMSYRKVLLAAGSVVALAGFLTVEPLSVSQSEAQMFFGKVGPAKGEPDGNGVPCFGFLDGGGQCLTTQNATS